MALYTKDPPSQIAHCGTLRHTMAPAVQLDKVQNCNLVEAEYHTLRSRTNSTDMTDGFPAYIRKSGNRAI